MWSVVVHRCRHTTWTHKHVQLAEATRRRRPADVDERRPRPVAVPPELLPGRAQQHPALSVQLAARHPVIHGIVGGARGRLESGAFHGQ